MGVGPILNLCQAFAETVTPKMYCSFHAFVCTFLHVRPVRVTDDMPLVECTGLDMSISILCSLWLHFCWRRESVRRRSKTQKWGKVEIRCMVVNEVKMIHNEGIIHQMNIQFNLPDSVIVPACMWAQTHAIGSAHSRTLWLDESIFSLRTDASNVYTNKS